VTDHTDSRPGLSLLPDGWVPGEGDHSGVMIVGEAPGAEEWEHKRPFIGDAGRFLRVALGEAGIDPADVWITNTVKVFPPIDGRSGKKKKPSPAQIEAARPYLNEEIWHLAPRYILALGGVANRTLTGSRQGITRCRGSWQPLNQAFGHEAQVLPTFHPSYIRQFGKKFTDVWETDLAEFADRAKAL
jgi:uracil-DNA glycosylase